MLYRLLCVSFAATLLVACTITIACGDGGETSPEATGAPTYSDEFQQDLKYWDDLLTDLIDPLVAEGYLQWASLPEMGELYLEWEEECGLD